MRLIFFVSFLALASSKVSYYGYKGLTVVTPDERSVAFVDSFSKLGVKILHEPNTNRPCELAVPPEIFNDIVKKIEDANLAYTKIYDNLEELVNKQINGSNTNRDRAQYRSAGRFDYSIASYFPTYQETKEWLHDLARKYPQLARIVRIGRTHENNEQIAIQIGSSTGRKKPVIWIDGGIHAREWATVPTVLYIATRLLAEHDSRGSRDSTKSLLDKYDFYFLPIFNPDGYIHTHDQDRFWRKNRRPHGNYGDCQGVDLNRNFGHHWGESGVSFDECHDSYLGAGPFSELETQNVRDTLLKFRGRLQMYLNLHAYGQLWFIPYAYDKYAYFDTEDEHRRVAEAAVRAISGTSYRRTSYRVGKPGQVLYNAAGGTFDWVYAVAGAKYAFAAELSPSFYRGRGLSGFEVSPNEMPLIAEEVYNGVRAAIDAM